MRNAYEVLGVDRTADAAEIRAAFRRIAKDSHPDRNPGDAAAARRFQDARAAYDVLGDPARRQRYDAGEIDAEGRETPFARAGGFAGGFRGRAAGRGRSRSRGAGSIDDVLRDLFGDEAHFDFRSASGAAGGGFDRAARAGAEARGADPNRGEDLRFTLDLSFLEAAHGTTRELRLAHGRKVRLRMPEAASDGRVLRLKGGGAPGRNGAPAGDALITLRVARHPLFERDGLDIRFRLPVTLKEAALGARVTAPTLRGPVALQVPKGASTGKTLRLKGRGLRDPDSGVVGDAYCALDVMLPSTPDPALEAFARTWRGGDEDPRAALMAEAAAAEAAVNAAAAE